MQQPVEPTSDLDALKRLSSQIDISLGHIMQIEGRFERGLEELRRTRSLMEQYHDRTKFFIERREAAESSNG